jgi:hypothetical protein
LAKKKKGGHSKMVLEKALASENEKRHREAHEEANRHLVSAGIVLAAIGIPRQAPEMKALAAALRAVNRAGGLEVPRPHPEREFVHVEAPREGRRFGRQAL